MFLSKLSRSCAIIGIVLLLVQPAVPAALAQPDIPDAALSSISDSLKPSGFTQVIPAADQLHLQKNEPYDALEQGDYPAQVVSSLGKIKTSVHGPRRRPTRRDACPRLFAI